MIIQWLFVFFLLSGGVDSAINATYRLTPEENNDRIEKCGRFPLPSSSNRSITRYPTWLYAFRIRGNYHLVTFISQKHVLISSSDVLNYSKGHQNWTINGSVFNREEYCKTGNKYLEVPTDVAKDFENSYRFTVLQCYILDICDQSAPYYPMLLVMSKSHEQFACIADERTSNITDIFVYNLHNYSSYQQNILSINDSSIVLNTDKKGEFGGPVVIVVGGRVTLFGVTPHSRNSTITLSAERIGRSLCTLFGICNKKNPKAATIGGQFTSTSTANMTHSASTDDPMDRQNSTTSSVIVVTQVTDFTDEIDVAYDEFMAEYEKMMKKEYEEGKAKDGSSGNKLLSIELCVLILTAHCLIY